MSKKNLSPVATAVGAAVLVSAAMNVSAGNANANPFAAEELSSGYNLAMNEQEEGEKKKEGKCGEGKCGEGKKKEGSCGEGKKKEGSCGEGKKKEGSCGEGKKKEGSCGN